MRGLFFLLLLSNVAFLLWQSFKPESVDALDAQISTVPVINEGLTLLSELDRTKRPPLRETLEGELVSVAEPAGVSGQGEQTTMGSPAGMKGDEKREGVNNKDTNHALCLRMDEIDNEAAFQQVLGVLEANGATVIEQGEVQASKTNYWVMLPPYRNRAKADEAAAILRDKRVNDFFIVRSGEYENAVSLGVFSEQERAERRYNDIVSLKVRLRKPRIETIDLPTKHYFVSFSIKDLTIQQHLQERLNALGYPTPAKVECN